MPTKNPISNTIRMMMLEHPELVRDILLSDSEISLYESVKDINEIGTGRGLDSHQLSETDDISVQSASARLKRLYQKGYLSRKQEPDPTGGIRYVYSAAL